MKSTYIDIISELQATHEGDNWLGVTFQALINATPAALAFQPPPGGRHSIAGIIRHMTTWKELLVKRLQGDPTWDIDQEASFDLTGYPPNSQGWQAVLDRHDRVQQALLLLLQTIPEPTWDQTIAGRKYTVRYLANGLLQHDLYHLGQLALLKAQLEAMEQ